MNETLNSFREGVIAERAFARSVSQTFGPEQWHARCEHLAGEIGERSDTPGERFPARQYGRLAVALFTLEGTYGS